MANSIKTPVSILNEMMIKKKIVPIFELIQSEEGSTINKFTYQVSCDGLVAVGSATSKKDAKHEASKEMLKKIEARNAQLKLAELSLKRTLPMEDLVSPSKKPRDTFIGNAIGALYEYCTKELKQVPQFKVEETGPSHVKTFSVTCTVSTFIGHGVGKTKKQAKTEAARNILDIIHGNVPAEPMKVNSKELQPPALSTLQISQNEKKDETDSQIAKKGNSKVRIIHTEIIKPKNGQVLESKAVSNEIKNIKEVSSEKKVNNVNSTPCDEKTNTKEITDGNLKPPNNLEKTQIQNSLLLKFMQNKGKSNIQSIISDGHFKKTYDDKTRELILNKIIHLMKQLNNTAEITNKVVCDTRQSVTELLKPLKLAYNYKELETKSSKFIVLIEISTNPDISEVGIASESIFHAEINGIKLILQLLNKLL